MHLDHINLHSPNPDKSARFYEKILDMQVTRLGDQYWHCSAVDRNILISESEQGLGFGAYACDSREELQQLRNRLEQSGCDVLASISPLFQDADAFSIRDPDGNMQVFSVSEGDRSDAKGTPLLGRLQHLVVVTDDIAPMQDFYQTIIGLELSDRVVDENGKLQVCFLRGDHEHHCFAIFGAGSKRLDHHSYEAVDWNLIRDWADHLVANDVKIIWGPGRHGAGNNLFLMFNDFDGNWLEISAELETIPPGREAGTWEHCEKTLNLWGKGLIRT